MNLFPLIIFLIIIVFIAFLSTFFKIDLNKIKRDYLPKDLIIFNKIFRNYDKWITIVVAVYNRLKKLPLTLNSIINESIFDHLDVILLDDCSTDGSYDLENHYSKIYSNIRCIKNEKNSSLYMVRRIGAENARCKYVYFMDADDMLDKYYLEELLSAAICEKTLPEIVASNNFKLMPRGKIIHGIPKKNLTDIVFKYEDKDSFIVKHGLSKYLIYIWTKIYRKDWLLDVFEKVPKVYINQCEDVFMSYFLMYCLHNYIVVDNVNMYNYYNDLDTCLTNVSITPFIKNLKVIYDIVNKTHYNKYLNKFMKQVFTISPFLFLKTRF